jgi:hypothetical protein
MKKKDIETLKKAVLLLCEGSNAEKHSGIVIIGDLIEEREKELLEISI